VKLAVEKARGLLNREACASNIRKSKIIVVAKVRESARKFSRKIREQECPALETNLSTNNKRRFIGEGGGNKTCKRVRFVLSLVSSILGVQELGLKRRGFKRSRGKAI